MKLNLRMLVVQEFLDERWRVLRVKEYGNGEHLNTRHKTLENLGNIKS